jgi:hypothetical protein
VTCSRPLLALVATAAALALTGCAGDPARDHAGVRDGEIVQAIQNLDGVDSSDVELDDSFGNGSRYEGDVEVALGADAGCVLVQTLGLLKQGRPGVALSSVTVRQGDVTLTVNDLTPEQQRVLDTTIVAADGDPVIPAC